MKNIINYIKNKYLIILGVLILAFFIFINVFYFKGPLIVFIGKNVITTEVHSKYIDDNNYKFLFFDNELHDKVLKISNVNLDKLGEYNIDYTLYLDKKEVKRRRKVKVVDTTKPDLVLKDQENSVACPNGDYIEQGYEANDNYDGDITSKVKITKKGDTWTYTIKDTSGNKEEKVRNIVRKDETAPVITLKTTNTKIYKGTTFTEPGYTAIDNCDGDITDKVKVDGKVNTSSTGKYTLTYTVTDSHDNNTVVTREIEVVNQTIYLTNTIYLTFDDGPSSLTSQYLDVLKKYNVKATFFINDKGYYDQVKRMHNEGHVVANHTASHNFAGIYSSTTAFWNDFNKLNATIKNLTGVDNKLFRFPGGSSNTVSRQYNRGIMTQLVKEANAKGLVYFDWNVDSDDAGRARDGNTVYNNVVNSLSHSRANIVLMHEGKNYTLNALSRIIEFGINNGYNFATLNESSATAHHGVNN